MDYKEKYEALVDGINGWLDKYVGDGLPFDKTGEIAKDIIKLVPELRESEDERMRKSLIEYLKTKDHECDHWIAWLEEQKEQKSVACGDCKEYDLGFERGREEGVTAGYNKAMKEMEQKEQKPVENTPSYSAAKKYFDSWIEMHRDSPTKWGCFWEGILYSGKLRPAECGEEDERIRKELLDFISSPDVSRMLDEEKQAKWFAWLEFAAGRKEQKPAEWTDADEKILGRIIDRLKFVIPLPAKDPAGVTFGATFERREDTEAINWLKKRVTSQPQPKQEWSEEEVDAMVKAFSDNLPLCGEFQTYHDALVHTYRQGVLAALKAIRPQPKQERTEEDEKNWGQIFACIADDALKEWLEKQKAKIIADLAQTAPWSDEDAVGLDRARDILRSCRGQVPGYESDDGISEHDDAIRTLERIRPARPHWRPSEEQMETLKKVIFGRVIGKDGFDILESLHDDLKEL